MKRDMDLVRQLLIATENAAGPFDAASLALGPDAPSAEEIVYHVRLLEAHGLVDAAVRRDITGGYSCTVHGLTWDGCDYLDAVRDGRVWERTKRVVSETVGSTTMDVIKEAAKAVATGLIKAALA